MDGVEDRGGKELGLVGPRWDVRGSATNHDYAKV